MLRQLINPKKRGSRFKTVTDVIAELRKVVWLSKREAAYLTLLVLVVTIIMAALLGAVDLGFTRFVEKFFLG